MKRQLLWILPLMLALATMPVSALEPITRDYGDILSNGWFWLDTPGELWDLTQCDLTVSYELDMSGYTPPMWETKWSSVGVGDGAWGWMASGAPAAYETDPNNQDLDDKLNLGAPDRYDEASYDATGLETLDTPPIGNPWINYGIWFDRDGVDPYQANMWGMYDGDTYNTGGIYDVEVTYHAINANLGTMFATVNGVQTGFYDTWKNAEPDYYPVGKSISGDLTRLRIFAAIAGQNVGVYNLTVNGCFYLDDQGPATSDVTADPNLMAVGGSVSLAATVDDTDTGGTNIASAEYTVYDSNETVVDSGSMAGDFNSPIVDVSQTFLAPTQAGIYDLCVSGTDAAGNIGPEECTMLVVYDPDGGFVTGGGWINSPPGAYLPDAYRPEPGVVVVTADNVGVDWSTSDTRYPGYVAFVEGPATPPLGTGSLEMGTFSGVDKAQLFNYDHIGTLLADIDSLTYATYRNSSSTNPAAQYPAINIEVDYVGDGSSYTTLVWEPIYAYGQGNLALDTWQTWDAMAPSQTGFGGGWWSTKNIPGVCAFNCFVAWDTILQNNPNAKIKYGFGVNVGSGWNGVFVGAVDALTLVVNGESVTYDFEPVTPPPDYIGKATFGFVSKYKKGASVPEGNTEFVFKAADLNFHSSSYDWLVVTGSDYAKFKGAGTINGMGDYKFMIWAGDGEPDTFRIKIWEEDELGNETVTYDNGFDQEIAGGSIVIHTGKK